MKHIWHHSNHPTYKYLQLKCATKVYYNTFQSHNTSYCSAALQHQFIHKSNATHYSVILMCVYIRKLQVMIEEWGGREGVGGTRRNVARTQVHGKTKRKLMWQTQGRLCRWHGNGRILLGWRESSLCSSCWHSSRRLLWTRMNHWYGYGGLKRRSYTVDGAYSKLDTVKCKTRRELLFSTW